jgi:hypothetical protein
MWNKERYSSKQDKYLSLLKLRSSIVQQGKWLFVLKYIKNERGGIELKQNIKKACYLWVIFFLTACSLDSVGEQKIKITAGEKEIQVIAYEEKNNQALIDFEQIHKNVKNDIGWEDLPYIPLNETILMEVSNLNVKELVIEDYILSKNGEFKYSEEVAESYIIPFNDGKASFDLKTNVAALLSSNSGDYLPGNSLRCFIVYSNSTPLFTFLLRTDAS